MKKITFLILPILFFLSQDFYAQDAKQINKPFSVKKAFSVTKMPSISSKKTLYPSTEKTGEVQDGRATRHEVIIGKGNNTPDFFANNPSKMEGAIVGKMPSLVFETAQSNSQPTDPSGAIGRNHYFAVFNTGFRIFDKDGNALTQELGVLNIFPENNQCCDLTVSYDNLADRWIVSILSSTNGVQVAVSDGPDPVNDSWNVYLFPNIADYNKLSVWRDGYYITQNGSPNEVWVLDRAAALAGNEDAQIIGFSLPGLVTNGFNSAQAFNITNDVHPKTGPAAIVYMQDDAWTGVDNDHIKLWEIDLDTNNFSNSTISDPQEIVVSDFISVFDGGSFANLPQPNGGQAIDALQATIMNQAQFRKFDNHNSAIFNFVVDTDATDEKLAGIRWMEFRQAEDGGTWSLYQEGTYTAPDNKHAWHGSMAMDAQGNIGLGYTSMGGPNTVTDGSVELTLSSYYTGRFANDELGVMSVQETLIATGAGNIPGSERYGDYGKMDVDPIGDRAFWFLNEYVGDQGRANVLGVFQLAPTLTNDAGVVLLNSPNIGLLANPSAEIGIEIFNYGSEAISNFEVSFQIDGGAVVTETFADVINPGETSSYVFDATANLNGSSGTTYEIAVCTSLTGDGDDNNDCKTIEVTLLEPNDLGVVALLSPISQEGLTDSEEVTILIENFGADSQTNFDVSYVLNGGATVVETVNNTIESGATLEYTFSQTINVSAIEEYELTASTLLDNDGTPANDSFTTQFSNQSCLGSDNTTSQAVGPDSNAVTESIITIDQDFVLTDVNVTVNINHTWVGDLLIEIIAPDGTAVVLANRTGGTGNSGDNYINTLFDSDSNLSINEGTAPFTGTFAPLEDLGILNGLTSGGDWKLRITDNANDDGGTLNSWSIQLCASEVLGVPEDLSSKSNFEIFDLGENLYRLNLNTQDITERLDLDVYNLNGQRLLNRRILNNGTGYQYDLDMSYAAAGVYIVRLGNAEKAKVGRIIVK
ncbi:proprotein convertase P-domain-containing protein [Dokdonia sp. Hel_I_53]|uniref:proprotein convertase P-domain-containing protein n=1 Tax=Dokdonia sp. Hel_I_53 TaxID=1566287 RepID=UPI001199DE77|nr:proprotein convertase P-domain-containing protein [Dokdonia sp. Hel_I_53]TVZ52453.1 putative secreted protein (Por secretion system target) [Dokdonia sp. Hel_I_53]